MSVNNSDIDDFMVRGGLERFKPYNVLQFKNAPWWESLFANSFIVRSIVCDVYKMDQNFMTPAQNETARKKALEQLAEVINITSKECSGRGIRFIVNFHFIETEFYNKKINCASVKSIVQKHNTECFDMMSFFIKQGVGSTNIHEYFWKSDGHHNNKGYALFAEGISSIL